MRSRRLISWLIVVCAAAGAMLLGAALGLGKWETYGLAAVVEGVTIVACLLWSELPVTPRANSSGSATR